MSITTKNIKVYQHKDNSGEITSALEVLKYVVDNDKLSNKVRRQIVDILLWKIPEYEGKYNVRYWSETIYNHFEKGESIKVTVEHVRQRKILRDNLINKRLNPDDLLDKFILCLKTVEEAQKLNLIKESDGWSRYKKAQISVYDSLDRRHISWKDL